VCSVRNCRMKIGIEVKWRKKFQFFICIFEVVSDSNLPFPCKYLGSI
jgi:hypothetical protein